MLGPAVAKSSMRKIFTWILTGSVAAVMIFAGSVKLVGTPNMVAAFKGFGYSLWLMYVWGALEIVSAALLFVPRYAFIGAASIVCIMVVQLYSHMARAQVDKAAPAAVLLALAVVLGFLRNWGRPLARTQACVRERTVFGTRAIG